MAALASCEVHVAFAHNGHGPEAAFLLQTGWENGKKKHNQPVQSNRDYTSNHKVSVVALPLRIRQDGTILYKQVASSVIQTIRSCLDTIVFALIHVY